MEKQSIPETIISDENELLEIFLDIETRCLKLENFEEPGMTLEQMIQKLMIVLQSIKDFQMFSPNQTLKEVHTQKLKFLLLPYHLGWLYGRIQEERMKAVLSSKQFLTSFLNLMDQFSCEQEEIFAKNLKKMWRDQTKEPGYRPPRDQLIQAMKDRKMIEKRYENWMQIKEEEDRRQALKDFISIQIHESITMLRNIEEEIQILKYKESIQKDPVAKEQHQNELAQPVPKMKVWQIPAKEEIHKCMCPEKTRKDVVTQVWQENANKPTMTLEEVAQLEIDNAKQRAERQAKQREEMKEDTDSDKEENDDRMKKKARAWDDWKDAHEKGAGNRNGR